MSEDIEDGIDLEDWPDCKIEDCEYKCCLALNSVYCYAHTPGTDYVKSTKIDALHSRYSFPGDPQQ
jgi:hypothetical protein